MNNNNNKLNQISITNNLKSRKIFQKEKRILSEEIPVDWKYETKDHLLKCKVDENHKYNIFIQTGFSFEDLDDVLNVMDNCSKLFYSNNYKIIGIENQNGGGNPIFSEIWHQLIQQKTLDKTFRSLIINDDAFDYFKKSRFFSSLADIETCKYFISQKEMGEIVDNYGISEDFHEEIKHHRSKIYDFLEKNLRKILEKIRKNNFKTNKKNLKNPTDIIIFTDSYCYSACSGFIKAFQNTGGAIIVGFNGNPKIKGTKEFDGSQSSSSVMNFTDTKEFFELKNLGYKVIGITYSESFDDSYQNEREAPIPREYAVDLVDRRVPIYGPYSDDLYEKFIKYADKIFEEFKNNCNKDNKRLILDDETCVLKGHEKGGHPCGDDGKWDKETCVAYYCDLGYYYDQYQKKCVLDICTNIENEKDIYINDISPMETKEWTIYPNTELVFHLQNDKYNYYFEANKENIFSGYINNYLINCSNLCMVGKKSSNFFGNVINANYFRSLKEPAKVKLTVKEKEKKILIEDNVDLNKDFVPYYMDILEDYQLIYSFQSNQKKIIYVPTFNKEVKMYYSENNLDITPQQILNIDNKKFKEISGAFLFVRQNDMPQYMMITNDSYLYLSQQNFDYNLYFDFNLKSVYIKLSSQTPEAEIEILNHNNFIINKKNKYFLFESNIKKLSLRLKNGNSALIEFLYKIENVNYLDINKNEFHLINETYNILKYKKSDNIESIKIKLKSNNTISAILYSNIGKGNYLGPIPSEFSSENKTLSSEFNIPNNLLDNEETFNILLKVKNNATLYIDLNGKGKVVPDKDGLNLFSLIGIILIFIIGIIMILVLRKIILRLFIKNKVNSENIEKRKFIDFIKLIEI